jgi:UDPglucose 6-dehydrogenase
VAALAHMAAIHGQHPQLLRSVMEINKHQRRLVVQKVRTLLGSLQDKTVGLLGLSFKPNTDDMRESPAVEVAHMLLSECATVKAYDPVAMGVAARTLREVQLRNDPYDLAQGCDALVIITDWNEFKQLNLARIRDIMRQPIIVDGRNIYEPETMRALGFTYRGIGRGY